MCNYIRDSWSRRILDKITLEGVERGLTTRTKGAGNKTNKKVGGTSGEVFGCVMNHALQVSP